MTLPPGPRAPDPDLRARPTYLDVDLAAIRHNVARLAAVAGAPVCAVVKADGYGHGAVEVARAAVEAGAQWLAVALVEEGRQLRDAGLRTPILLFSEPPVTAIGALLDAELTPCVYRPAFIAALDAAALARQRDDGDGDDDLHDLHDHDDHDDHLDQRVAVHVKADTGMGRVGAPPEQWDAVLQQVASARGLRVDGLFTHLACADDTSPTGDETTRAQLAAYDRFLAAAARAGIDARWYHVANTAGLLRHPDARRGLVRPGIGVYGLSPDVEVDAADHGLRPALRVVSEVSYAKRVAAGTPVSYGHRWRAPADGWVATVPIGYADGVPRALTNRGAALHAGVRRPIAGTVTMDQLMLWCGDDEPHVGDEVVLLGAQGDQRIRVEEWAEMLDTITYEIVTQLTSRLPRFHRG